MFLVICFIALIHFKAVLIGFFFGKHTDLQYYHSRNILNTSKPFPIAHRDKHQRSLGVFRTFLVKYFFWMFWL